MRYDLAIFDLDGTLADSFPFFVSVQNRLAVKHGFRRIDPDEIESLRHHSARELMRHVGLPRWKLPWVARSFVRFVVPTSRITAPDCAITSGTRKSPPISTSSPRETITS